MSSKRLPGKVMRPLLGMPMIGRQIERLDRARRLEQTILVTSTDASDDDLASYVAGLGLSVFRGDLDNVLARFYQALLHFGKPEHFLRLTGDCPLADPDLIDQAISHHLEGDFDYTQNSANWTFPKGLDVEVIRFQAFENAYFQSQTPYQKEHVTPFLYQNPETFKIGRLYHDPPLRFRWTVDEAEDFIFVTRVYQALYPEKPDFRMADILDWQVKHPHFVRPYDPFFTGQQDGGSL